MGRRLTDFYFTATTSLEYEPKKDKEEAGMTLLNNGSHFDLSIHKKGGERILLVKLQFGQTLYKSKAVVLEPGPVLLRVTGEKSSFTFSYAQGEEAFTDIETVDSKFLATETVGFFTGIYVGFYATGNGEATTAFADYDWFEYVVHDPPRKSR